MRDEILRHLRALTGGRQRPTNTGGEWVAYRVLRARLAVTTTEAPGFGRALAKLRKHQLVESKGRGGSRHYALTLKALAPVEHEGHNCPKCGREHLTCSAGNAFVRHTHACPHCGATWQHDSELVASPLAGFVAGFREYAGL